MKDVIIKQPVGLVYKGGYQPKFCELVVSHLKSGKSLPSFGGVIGVTHNTIKKWMDEYEEFRDAVEIAESVGLGTWEDLAIDQVTGDSKGSTSALTFMMKNQYAKHYKDKVSLEAEGSLTYIIDTGIPQLTENKMTILENTDVDMVEDEEEGWITLNPSDEEESLL